MHIVDHVCIVAHRRLQSDWPRQPRATTKQRALTLVAVAVLVVEATNLVLIIVVVVAVLVLLAGLFAWIYSRRRSMNIKTTTTKTM